MSEDVSRSQFYRIREDFFQSFRTKFLSLLYMMSLAYKISHCHSANRNLELRCVICNGVTFFLHWCYSFCSGVTIFFCRGVHSTPFALLSPNQNQVIFSCVLLYWKYNPY